MVGIPFYCHAYKLLTSKLHGYHSPAIGKGECDAADYKCVSDIVKHDNIIIAIVLTRLTIVHVHVATKS